MTDRPVMTIGIDALWVRHGIVGGTESYLRNLLHGFGSYAPDFVFIVYTSLDNDETFSCYDEYPNIRRIRCNVESSNRVKRILWENRKLDRRARNDGIDLMFIPVYSKPVSLPVSGGGIPYISTIHDLQALHYPEYFGTIRRLFLYRSWKETCKTSACIVTDSDFCARDIREKYSKYSDKVKRIYVPVICNDAPRASDSEIRSLYGIESGKYDYCVSSLLPHKNLDTLLRARALMEDRTMLVVSGVGGLKEEFESRVRELGLEDRVLDTGFVSDEIRDALYDNCRMFLFPSIFEGFGMPPVEAMLRGKTVITTKESCLEEVTQGRAVYVGNATDPEEWSRVMAETAEKSDNGTDSAPISFAEYDLKNITEQYTELFGKCINDGAITDND